MPPKQRKFRDFLEHAGVHDIGVPMLLAAVVLLAAAMAMLGANVSAVRDNYRWVQRSNNALVAIAEINTLVIGVDMCARGYALTDDPKFLDYEDKNRHDLDREINFFAAITSGDPGQSANISKLRALVAKQEALFSQLASLGPGHAKDVATVIVDPVKRKIRYAAQDLMTAMHAAEVELLSTRQKAAESQVSYTFYLALGIVALAFAAGALGLALTLFGRRAAT